VVGTRLTQATIFMAGRGIRERAPWGARAEPGGREKGARR
jgi:hypothetical protein